MSSAENQDGAAAVKPEAGVGFDIEVHPTTASPQLLRTNTHLHRALHVLQALACALPHPAASVILLHPFSAYAKPSRQTLIRLLLR